MVKDGEQDCDAFTVIVVDPTTYWNGGLGKLHPFHHRVKGEDWKRIFIQCGGRAEGGYQVFSVSETILRKEMWGNTEELGQSDGG